MSTRQLVGGAPVGCLARLQQVTVAQRDVVARTSIEASVSKAASCRSRSAGRRVRGESRSSVAASRNVVKRANQSQTEVSAGAGVGPLAGR